MYYLKIILIILLVLLSVSSYLFFSMFIWIDYITLFSLSIFTVIIFYGFYKSWTLRKYFLLLIPLILESIFVFDIIPSEQCDIGGGDVWSVQCECKGIEVKDIFFGSSRCIGKTHSCKRRTPSGWEDYGHM